MFVFFAIVGVIAILGGGATIVVKRHLAAKHLRAIQGRNQRYHDER